MHMADKYYSAGFFSFSLVVLAEYKLNSEIRLKFYNLNCKAIQFMKPHRKCF